MSSIEKAMEKIQGKDSSKAQAQSNEAAIKKLIQEEPDENSVPEKPSVKSGDNGAKKQKMADEAVTSATQHTTDTGVEEQKSDAPSSSGQNLDSERTVADCDAVNKGRFSNHYDIDLKLLKQNGIVTEESDNKILREQFRAIKRKLLKNAFGSIAATLHRPNLIIVTSCNPQEGKTFSAINLALNIALEKDKTVLLVDADIVRPSVASRIGMKSGKGLTEYLSGDVQDISSVIFNTNIENFKFIPAGAPHELSTELLASSKMSVLAEELSSRYPDRVVIFDSPPLLGVNETHILANIVGQAIIVVVENNTKITDLQLATEQLDKEIAVGFVINKSSKHLGRHYGYGYRDYGHYAKD